MPRRFYPSVYNDISYMILNCSMLKLLELTERWRFIYNRLYDSETDMFDLSRIPDVHDNVRFE